MPATFSVSSMPVSRRRLLTVPAAAAAATVAAPVLAADYFQRQHVGATAWFLMAAQNFNPYQ
jgi:hypothetical protein